MLINFESNSRGSKRGSLLSLGAMLSIFALGAYLLGQTFSANIAINTGQPVEFGQGLLQTTSCSGSNSITLTPQATFVNGSGATGAWYFSGVTLSGIPSSCYGSKFTIKAFDSATSTALKLFGNDQNEINFVNQSGTFVALTGSNGITVVTNSSSSVTITFDQPISISSDVVKLSLESFPYSAVTTTLCSSYLGSSSNVTIAVSGGTCIATFTASTNSFTAPAGVRSVAVLVVGGGGGGGGGAFGGGGGAGGLIYNNSLNVTPGSTYSISVGAGGAGGGNTLGNANNYVDNSGRNGGDSVFGSLTAVGGGGGGGYTTTYKDYHTISANSDGVTPYSATKLASNGIDSSKGKAGGSGGGSNENTFFRASGTAGQGNSGGTPLLVGPSSLLNLESSGTTGSNQTRIASGGGGGGAGSAGGDVVTNHIAGNGGAGVQYSISGTSSYYAAGGGGGVGTPQSGTPTAGTGGSGIGGNGGSGGPNNGCSSTSTPTAGATNTGSGGGGAGFCNAVQSGGAGGSGVVILRFNP